MGYTQNTSPQGERSMTLYIYIYGVHGCDLPCAAPHTRLSNSPRTSFITSFSFCFQFLLWELFYQFTLFAFRPKEKRERKKKTMHIHIFGCRMIKSKLMVKHTIKWHRTKVIHILRNALFNLTQSFCITFRFHQICKFSYNFLVCFVLFSNHYILS